MRPHVVRVDLLPPEGATFEVSFEAPELEEALGEAGVSGVQAHGPLAAQVRLLPSGASDVFALGRFSGRVTYRCGRCLGEFAAEVADEFHQVYVRDQAGVGSETVLRREDLDVELLVGGQIDLTREVLEQFLLALEPHPVCREECPGLCPVCGADRNEGDCGCGPPGGDPRFGALAQWKTRSPG